MHDDGAGRFASQQSRFFVLMSVLNVFGGRVVFDHLPKSAGISINNWLRNELGESCVTHTLNGEHRTLIQRYGGDYSVLSGHMSFTREGLDPRYQYITCLREPIDRALSWLFFTTNNFTKDDLGDLWVAAVRFLESDGDEAQTLLYGHLKNPYVEHFASINGEAYKSDEQKLVAALDAIEKYDVWGFYEDISIFTNEVANLLGLNASQALPRLNQTLSRPALGEISIKLRQCLETFNKLDIQFYQELSKRYTARIRTVRSPSYLSPWTKYSTSERTFVDSDFRLLHATLLAKPRAERGSVLKFNLEFSLARYVDELEIGIHILDEDRRLAFGTNSTLLENRIFKVGRGNHRVQFALIVDLPEGAYTAGFVFAEPTLAGIRELAWFNKLVDFSVTVPRKQSFVGYCSIPVVVNYWHVSDSFEGYIKDGSGNVNVPLPLPDVFVNEVFSLPLQLQNTSTNTWAFMAINPLFLSYHWYEINGKLVIFEGKRTPFLELLVGEVVDLVLQVHAPAAPGRYHLAVIPMQEGVSWFDTIGFKPSLIEFNVLSNMPTP